MRILAPTASGNLELKNRVARTALGEYLRAHYVSDEFIAYHLARAKGGVAAVDPSSPHIAGIRGTCHPVMPCEFHLFGIP